MSKKLLSFFVAVAMLVSLIPTVVLAATSPVIAISNATLEAGQSATVHVSISGAESTAFSTIYLELEADPSITVSSVALSEEAANADFTFTKVGTTYQIDGDPFDGTVAGDINLLDVTIAVASDATNAAYSIVAKPASDDKGNIRDASLNPVECTFTAGSVTVGSSAATGYTAALSTSSNNNEVNGGSEIIVNVSVSHSSEKTFNAGEIVLEYDSSKLTLKADSVKDWSYTDKDGKLTIEDFGGDKTMSYTYPITFTAAEVDQDTETKVNLTSAAFVDKEDATENDLEKAAITPESVTITIKVPMVNVTLTNSADANETTKVTTEKGKDYIFAPNDTNNYTYSDVTATVDTTTVDVTDNGDGTFTIAGKDVTGDIAITYTKKANTYDVTTKYVNEEGNELSASTKEDAATYNTPYPFTVDADVEASATSGYTYTLTSVTINKVDYTGYSCAQGTKDYTIPGADISGDIVITIEKKEIPANTYTVTTDGEAAGDAKVEASPITQGQTAKITVTVDPGYEYTVTATMSGETATVDQADNVYTVANVTGNVVFTVNKTLDTTSVKVHDYATVQNNKIWLVIYDGTLASNKAPTYDGATMYWSDKYDAYCYLVIAANMDDATAQDKVSATTATATEVNYDMDINGTGIKDAADAQVVWNMYNAVYSNFTDMEMAKFLAADQNATSSNAENEWKINVNDAEVIVNYILTPTT